jgi:hypothetical protein
MSVCPGVELKFNIYIAVASILLALCGIASAKEPAAPANAPPPLSDAERKVGTPGIQFSEVIQSSGQAIVAQGAVREGETLLTIPYTYRYTAVLTEDVKGFSITVGGVQAPAGSPGYYVGSFIQTRGDLGIVEGRPMDMWCFFPRVAGGKRENICLLRNTPKLAAIAPTRMNPYLWDHFSPMTGTFDYVRTPIFKRQAIDLPVKTMLEYRFAGWKGDAAKLKLFAVGDFVRDLGVPRDANGVFRLRTVGGDFIITKDAADPTSARMSSIENPK